MTKKYNYDYPLAANTVDMVIFTIRRGRLRVLFVKRADPPFEGYYALPGGFIEVGDGHAPTESQGEDLDEAAERELEEETGLERERDDVFLEQLYTFGTPGRDPRGRVITVAYYALISPEAYHRVRPSEETPEVEWFDVEDLPKKLAFDHAKILTMAVQRVRGKIDYDPRLAQALLAQEFTAKEFRRVHEIVKGVEYDPSNFSKRFRRMVEDGRFVETEELKEQRGAGRPAKLYRFPDDSRM